MSSSSKTSNVIIPNKSLSELKTPQILVSESICGVQNPRIKALKREPKYLRGDKVLHQWLFDKQSSGETIKYQPCEKQLGFGRVYPYQQSSIFSTSRPLRSFMTRGTHLDLDICNAHPVIMKQFLELNGLKCPPELEAYINNRDDWLAMLPGTWSRDVRKRFFLIIMYHGGIDTWRKSCGVPASVELPAQWTAFDSAMKKVAKSVFEIYECVFPEIIEHRSDSDNPRGTIMSINNQIIECQILVSMLRAVADYCSITLYDGARMDADLSCARIIPGVIDAREMDCILLHDGMLIGKQSIFGTMDDAEILEDAPDMLKDIEARILADTGYAVTLKFKEIAPHDAPEMRDMTFDIKRRDDAGTIINDIWRNLQDDTLRGIAAQENLERYYDPAIMDKLDSYSKKLKYFELFHAQCGEDYIFMEDRWNQSKIELFTKESMTRRYCNHRMKDRKKFIELYMDDENKKFYISMGFEPQNERPSFYNLFRGFPAAQFTPGANMIHGRPVSAWLDDFEGVIRMLCENNEAYAKLFLDFMAHIFQRPDKKCEAPIAFVFTGPEGSGKDFSMDIFGSLMGSMFGKTSDPENDIFGKHAVKQRAKMLMVINESRANYDICGNFKSFVTETSMRFEMKYQNAHDISNYARLVMCSNKLSAAPIDTSAGDRRYIVFKTKKSPKAVFEELVKVRKDPAFLRGLYDRLMARNIDISNFRAEKWRTETYKNSTAVMMNGADYFMCDICDYDEKSGKILVGDAQLNAGAHGSWVRFVASELRDALVQQYKGSFGTKRKVSPLLRDRLGDMFKETKTGNARYMDINFHGVRAMMINDGKWNH